MAEKKHQGEFRCTAQNSIEMGTAKMTLNVMYGPQIRVKVCEFRVKKYYEF